MGLSVAGLSGHRVYNSAMSHDAYSPELMELMSTAFDAAYDQVFGEPSQAFQLQLATRIMAAVNAGERDLDRLVGVALGEVELQVAEDVPGNLRAEMPSPGPEPSL